MDHCKSEGILFHNLDAFGQTMLLREQANALRARCDLQPFQVIYDPLDAGAIVEKLASSDLGKAMGLQESIETLAERLQNKYATLLEEVAALRGASQIINLAIKTLEQELPPKPPTVAELRRSESASKQALVSSLRL